MSTGTTTTTPAPTAPAAPDMTALDAAYAQMKVDIVALAQLEAAVVTAQAGVASANAAAQQVQQTLSTAIIAARAGFATISKDEQAFNVAFTAIVQPLRMVPQQQPPAFPTN